MLIFNKNVSVNFYVMIKVLEVFTDRVENIFFFFENAHCLFSSSKN